MKNKLAIGTVGAGLVVAGMMISTIVARQPDSKATTMVKAQAPDAECVEYGTRKGVEVSICTLPSTPNKDAYVSVYGHGPWQAFALKSASAAQQTAAKPAPAPAPTPADAGVGSDSGSGQGSGKGSGSGAAKK